MENVACGIRELSGIKGEMRSEYLIEEVDVWKMKERSWVCWVAMRCQAGDFSVPVIIALVDAVSLLIGLFFDWIKSSLCVYIIDIDLGVDAFHVTSIGLMPGQLLVDFSN